MTKRYRVGLMMMLAAAVTACDLAPVYHRPSAPVPEAFKENAGWHAATGNGMVSTAPWWHVFGDDRLNALEAQAHADNQNLQAALARYDQAHALLQGAQGALLPQVNASASATRERDSLTTKSSRSTDELASAISGLETASGKPPLPASSNQYNDFSAQLDSTYDLDVFGRLRDTAAAAGHEAKASADDLAALSLSLQAQVAQSYFTLRADDAQIDILQQSLKTYEEQLKLTETLFHGGIDPELNVDQARLQLDNARADLEGMQLQRGQMEHAIAILAGVAPANFKIDPEPFHPVIVPVDTGLPSRLLERRPDIASAEQHVASANEQIGVARAAWFPDLTLGGTIGYESETVPTLFSAPSLFWSLGPQLAQTVFDGGQIDARIAQARAAYREAVANYRQAVLSALQDVEDNLAAIRQYTRETGSRRSALADADHALSQALSRYREGIDPYLNVIVQENAQLQAKQSLTQVQLNAVMSYILLVKAIGGDTQKPR